MRCMACDVILTEAEDRRTFLGSGQRVQLCSKRRGAPGCADYVDVPMTPIKPQEDVQEDDEPDDQTEGT